MDERHWEIKTNLLGPHGENDIVFTSEYWHLLKEYRKGAPFNLRERSQVIIAINHLMDEDEKGFTSNDTSEPWSHDNHTALVCLSKLFDLPYHRKLLWRGWWRRIHPRDLIFYAYMSGGVARFISYFFLPLLFAIMLISMRKTYKITNGDIVYNTSGKLLALLRMMSCPEFELTRTWCDALIVKGFKNWANVFKIYFIDEEHPNLILARAIFEGE